MLQRQRLLRSTDTSLLGENRLSDGEADLGTEEDQGVDIYGDNLADLPGFSVGTIMGETWGTNYDLKVQFEVEDGELDAQTGIDSPQGMLKA